ncbi:hypothetical protein SAMN04489716_1619 [Actinoplanes derwentensis]|uniref:Uncharacterized protein n=1 Tax=Actinoplanes derwentensis TaxID=113562 RepID=A0A1H1V2H4_9ACTN|nr:hypothetical protein Ade03nite_87590 [Actinoplanes derwentensis]SDS78883.1 hypothetical protein SAMN04489716_1619 [Actinoplanes derwentensis]
MERGRPIKHEINVGDVFGKLTVLDASVRVPMKNGYTKRGVVVECACGSKLTIGMEKLYNGREKCSKDCSAVERLTLQYASPIGPKPVSSSYMSAHQRLKRRRGKATEHTCPCGKPAKEWAYNHACPNEMKEWREARQIKGHGTQSGRWMPFSQDIEMYDALCYECHAARDGNGH